MFRAIPLVLLLLGVGGCASWRNADPPSIGRRSGGNRAAETLLKPTASRVNRVVLRAQFVPYALDDSTRSTVNDLWSLTDDSQIPWESRKAWAENGLRAGVILSTETMNERLESLETTSDRVTSFLNEANIAGDVSRGITTIPMKMGVRKELPLRHPIEGSHVAMLADGDQVIGRTLQAAQYLMSITASPADSVRRLRLRLQPEIQHGVAKQKYLSSQAAIRIDSRRDSWVLDPLAIDWVTQDGAALLMGPTETETGLASAMLGGQNAQGEDERMLLVIHVDQVPQ